MPSQKKITTVENLKSKLDKAKAVFLADYRGLTHKQLEELHKLVKKAEGELLVVKNSLLKIASQTTDYRLPTTALTGPTAILLSYADEIAPLREFYKFIKTHAIPKIKIGFIGKTMYDQNQIIDIAKLPSKEVLQAKVVSRLSGPMYGLVYTLNGNLQKLVYILSKIQK